jgi:hypothetical protein
MISKRAITIGGAILLVGVVLALWGARSIGSPVPDARDVWVPENAVVLDSAQIRGSPKAFVFQYDIGALGYSITMASLGKPSHLPGFLLLKGSARHVWWATPDTLMVEVTSDQYELSRPPNGIVVVPTHAEKTVQ